MNEDDDESTLDPSQWGRNNPLNASGSSEHQFNYFLFTLGVIFACVFFAIVFSVLFYLRVGMILDDVRLIDSPKTFDKAARVVTETELGKILYNTGIIVAFWLFIILEAGKSNLSKGIDSQTSGHKRYTPFGLLAILLKACFWLLDFATVRILVACAFIYYLFVHSQLIPWLGETVSGLGMYVFYFVHFPMLCGFLRIGNGEPITSTPSKPIGQDFWEAQDRINETRSHVPPHYP